MKKVKFLRFSEQRIKIVRNFALEIRKELKFMFNGMVYITTAQLNNNQQQNNQNQNNQVPMVIPLDQQVR